MLLKDEKKRYYFCNTHMAFARGCQVITLHTGDKMEKVAETWAKINGYKSVYVYDMNHNFVWSYNF